MTDVDKCSECEHPKEDHCNADCWEGVEDEIWSNDICSICGCMHYYDKDGNTPLHG